MSVTSRKLLVLERKQNGEILRHLVQQQLQITAQPGSAYSLVDGDTGKPPKAMKLKRNGQSLVIEEEGAQVAEIREFYDDQSAAFSTDGSFSGAADSTVTPATPQAAGADTLGHLVWPADQGAGLWIGGVSPLGALGGLGLVGLAAAGGGGGGGGKSGDPAGTTPVDDTPAVIPDTVAPGVPAGVLLASSDANDGSNPSNGVNIKVLLPSDASVGDTVTTVVNFNGGKVATIVTTLTAADLKNGYATQHVDYRTIDADGVIDDGTYETVTTLTDAAGNTSQPFTNSQAFIAFTGLVHDDYIANAVVFVDSNNNGRWDEGEATTTTDSNGYFKFTFNPNGAPVLAMGGIDTASGAPNNTLVFKAYGGNLEAASLGVDIVLSPLSTLIASVAESTVGSGQPIDAAALLNAAAVVNSTLGLGATDPAALLKFDPVAQATATGATEQQIDLLAANRQLAVLLGATGSLIDGASGGNGGGSGVAASALAQVVLNRADSQGSLDLASSADVQAVLQNAMTQANTGGVTTDLRASNTADLTAVADLVAGFTGAVGTATEEGALSDAAKATMRAASDTLFTALAGAGSEATTTRGGDLSLAAAIADVTHIADVGVYVQDKVANVTNVQTSFETNEATGHVGSIVRLDIQLPSIALGKTVDTLDIGGVPAGASLILINPLTQAQTVLTPDANGVYHVKPSDAGYLAIKATTTLIDDPATFGIIENSLSLTATKTIDGVTTTYTGSLPLNITPAPVVVQTAIGTIADDAGGKSGNLTSGSSTDDTTPTLSGNLNTPLLPGQQVTIYDGDHAIGQATVTGTGWTFTPSTPLLDGQHTLTVRVETTSTPAEIVSVSQPIVLDIDTTGPVAPTIQPSGGKTISGEADPGSTVTVSAGGTVIGTAVADKDGHWTLTPSTPLADGTTLTATATDRAGNGSPVADPVHVDTGVPGQQPTLTGALGGTGALTGGGYTNDATPTLSGTLTGPLNPGQKLAVFDGDTKIGEATVSGTGWTFTPTTDLPGGTHNITLRVAEETSGGGEKYGPATAPFTFTVDAVAPVLTVTIASAYDDVAMATGQIANDGAFVTNDARPQFSGSLSANLALNETLVAYDTRIVNGAPVTVRLGVATVSGTSWSFTPAYALADATHSVTFRVEDKAGNVGASSAAHAFTVDTVDTSAPTVTSPALAPSIDETGGPNQVIYTPTADDTGDVSGGLTWSLKPGSDPGLTIDPATGAVTLTGTPNYEEKSSYTFTVVVTDKAGNKNEKTVTLALENSDEVAPTITSGDTATAVAENSGINQVIYTATADDSADISGGYHWTLKNYDAGLSIDGTTGEVKLSHNPDFETKSSYTFTVVATDVAGNVREKTVTLGILNDDASVSIAVSETSIQEGSSGTQKTLVYTVSRSLTTGAGTVDWGFGGTVDADDLSGPTSGTLTFAANEASKTFTVTVVGDKAMESTENLVVNLSNPQGDLALGTTSSATTAIVTDDGTVSISVDKTDIAEGNAGTRQALTYTVTRSNGVAAGSVNWALSGMDAADLASGQALNGSVSFAAGETTKTFTVTVIGDKVAEASETLVVSLSNPGNNLTLGTATASTAVRNDDSLISVDAVRGSVAEGNNGESQVVVFRITRSNGISATSVDWSLDGTATAADLAVGQAMGGSVSFAANETEKFVSITVAGDRNIEANESLVLKLSNAGDNAAIGVGSASTTIVNDDNGMSIEAVSTNVAEGAEGGTTPLVFRVVRSDSSGAASVNYKFVGVGSEAVGETDFVPGQGQVNNDGLPSGTVSFSAGQSEVLVTVMVAGDAVHETAETFSIVLDTPSAGTQILQGEISGTVLNDDMVYSIAAVEDSVLEGTVANAAAGGVQHFVITRQGDLSQASTVGYAIAGYGDNNASNDDFTSLVNSTVTFAAGASAVTLAIDIAGDSQLEGYEAFKLSLQPTDSNTEIRDGVALATINPDDVGITIAAVNSQTFEDADGSHIFTISRTGYLGGSSVVSWHLEGYGSTGYQADADDFGGEFPSGTVTFAPDVDTIQISFSPRADLSFENNEGYRVVLETTQPGVILLQPTADGMLLNDESGLTLVASNLDRMEGNAGDTTSVSFSVERSGNIKTESVVRWELVHEGTTAGDFADNTPLSGYLTFAVGQDNKVVTLPLSVDNVIEADKQFKIRITSETDGTEVLNGEVDGFIRNDDAQFALQPLTSVTEGNAGSKLVTMNVVRTGDLSGSDTVDYTVAGSSASASDFAGGVYPHGTVLFAANEATRTITFSIASDSVKEDDESFTVTLGNNSNGTTIASSGTSQTVVIVNDDDSLSIAATDAVKAEGGSGMTDYVFTVTRDGYTGKSTSIGWSVEGQGGHPANAADFGGALPSGTVSFGEGETVKTITVSVSADNFNEADEGFRITLGGAPAGTQVVTGSASGTIVNDDTGLKIDATTTNLTEGDSGTVEHVFTVTRSGVVTGSTTVDWTVSGNVDAADFGGTLPSGTISFGANETVKTITLAATGDTTIESTEGFTVALSNASSNADIQVSAASGSIVADDVQIAITGTPSSTVLEGAAGSTQVLSYTVTRSGDTASIAVIDWAATGMDADDFAASTPFAGHLTFAAGQTVQTINLTLKGDNVYETDDVLTVTLTEASGNPAQGRTYITTDSVQTTVANDDASLSITANNADQVEGTSGAGASYVFTISPTGVFGADSVVEWRVSSIAAASNDFVGGQDGIGDNTGFPSGKVTFAAGQTAAIQVTVNVAGDSDVEGSETFSVNLSTSAANVELANANASATASIDNDDTAYAIHAVNASQAEGNTGTTEYTFNVVRSGVASGTAEVKWAVGGSGTHAADAADFVNGELPSGTVTFTGTETTKTITISVAADTIVENDEGYTVTISDAPSPITTATATAVIRNEDQQFAVTTANTSVTEGDSGTQPLIFKVTRSGDTSVGGEVNYAITGSAGVASDDYVGAGLPAGTLSFGVNESEKLVTLHVRGDSIAEADDTYTLTLSAPSVGTLNGSQTSASTAVVNNDVALEVSAPASTYEGSANGGVTPFIFTVTRSGATAGQQTVVDWVVQGGAATAADFAGNQDSLGANFGLPSGKLTFAAGATVMQVTVNVAQDTQVELDESFGLRLQNPTTTDVELRKDSATTTILADDSGFSIAAVVAVKKEGEGASDGHVFSVTRGGDLSQSATAHWAVTGSGGNAASAADFPNGTLPFGDVTFAAGESVQLITVKTSNDQTAEYDEGFTVTLSGVPGIVDSTAAGTIVNDDQNFSVSSAASIAEGNSSTKLITFTVSRTGDMTGSATVDFAMTTANGTADDYVGSLPSGTLTFAPNQNQLVVTLAVKGDTLAESNESYTLTLTNPTGGATLGTDTATTTVTNDDTNFVLAAPGNVFEGHTGATTPVVFTVTRTGDISGAGSVQWKLQGATGLATDDFVGSQDALASNSGLPSGTVSFGAGSSVATITINVKGDTTLESDESLRVILSNPVGGTIEGSDGDKTTVLKTDDDSFAISGTASIWETHADSTVVYTIARTGSLTGARELTWTIGGSNGFDTADLAAGQASTGTLSFADGATLAYLTVGVKGDNVNESDETMTVTLSGAPDNTVLGTAVASTTIRNDDASVGITPVLASSIEGSGGGYISLSFVLTRSGYVNQTSTVSWSIDTTANNSVIASDFYNGSLPTGTVTFAPSETAKTIVVQINRDSTFEPDETIRVKLGSTSTGTSIDGANASADVTITNDDAKFDITAGPASLSEGDGGFAGTAFVYTVTRTGNLAQTNTVNWNVGGGTASATDFSNGGTQYFGNTSSVYGASLPNGTLTFASGVSVQTVTVFVRGDTAADNDPYYLGNRGSTEGDETFTLSLNGASSGSSIGQSGSYQSTILNDDTRLTMTVNNALQAEKTSTGGTTDYIYTVIRSGNSSGTTTANWSVMHNSTDVSDFTGPISGAVTFGADVTVQTFTVKVQGDDQVENQERFTVRLNGGSGYDEISATNSGLQSNYGDVYSYINRDEALFNIVDYSNAGSRYLSAMAEGDTASDGGTGDQTFVVRVQRTLAWAGEATVNWSVAGYTPTLGNNGYGAEATTASDFANGTLPSGVITFADGQTYGYLTVTVKADDIGEMDEGFQVILGSTSPGSSVGTNGTGYVIVNNDDTGFAVELTGGGNATEGGNLVYTIYRNDDVRGTDTIDWSWTLPGTETANEGNTSQGTWYQLDNSDVNAVVVAQGGNVVYDADNHKYTGTITFADGETSRNITISIKDDSLTESWRESVPAMTISTPVNTTGEANDDKETPFIETNQNASDTTYVYDNDADPLLSVTSNVTSIWEGSNLAGNTQAGNTVTFTITRSDQAGKDGALNYPTVAAWKFTGGDINWGGTQAEVMTYGGDALNVETRYYNTTYGVVSFAAGETTKTVTVTFYGDLYTEADKTLNFSVLSAAQAESENVGGRDYGPANYDVANASVSVDLKNDDIQLAVYPTSNYVNGSTLGNYEGDTLSFTISRSGRTDIEVTGNYTISGAAVTSGDITGTLTGTFTIPAGQNSVLITLNSLTLVDDSSLESNEAFTMTLTAQADGTAPNAYVRFDNGTSGTKVMTGYVYDDDSTYAVTNATPSKAELDSVNNGEVEYVFTIQRTNSGSVEGTQLKWKVEGLSGITASDFITGDGLGNNGGLPSGYTDVIWSNGVGYVTVIVRSDEIVEGNDTFRLALVEEQILYANHVNTFATPFYSATQTITNDDTGISIADQSIVEADGNQAMVFTVTRSGDLSGASTMNWTLGHLGTDANDFTGATSGSLTFGANVSVQTITVTVAGDVTPEAIEGFNITLSNYTGIDQVIDGQAAGSILNDDSSFAISAGSSVAEGSGQVFTITRTHVTNQAQIVNWAVSGVANGATADDFASGFPNGMVTFSGSELTKTVTITANADTTTETSEGYNVTISLGGGTTGDTISTAVASGTIINNDADYRVTANTASAVESHGGTTPFVFTVTRSGEMGVPATVDWTLGGTVDATDLANGQPMTGQVSFAPNVGTVAITVNVKGDTAFEPDESLTVTLSNASGADGDNIVGGPATSTVVNDDSNIAISAVSAEKMEGNSGTTAYTFQIVRTGYLDAAATVGYDVTGIGAHAADSTDFNGMTGTLNLAAGQVTTMLTILVNGDQTAEFDEDFRVTLSNPSSGVNITTATADGTIQSDDVWFDVTAPAAQLEGTSGSGTTDFAFVVTRSGALSGSDVLTWNVAGSGSNPADASDFSATTGTVTFAPNETALTIHVAVKQDSVLEAGETFTLSLNGPVGALYTHSSAEATIIDDETAFSIAPATLSKSEGADGTTEYVFTVTRSGKVTGSDTVAWNFNSSTTDAADFGGSLPGGGTLTFGVSETVKTITIAVSGDEQLETDESFTIGLTDNSAGTFLVPSASSATATIRNDDSSIAISAVSADHAEGHSGLTAYTFDVVRTGNLGTEATVAYTLYGTGITAADFGGLGGSLGGTLSLPANQTTTTLTIYVQGDRVAELDETFTVTLSSPSTGMTISGGTADGIIVADDVVFDVTASAPVSKTEGGDGAVTSFEFVVTRDGKLSGSQVLTWNAAGYGGDAANAADFVATTGTVTFAANETAHTITVQVKGDYSSEPDENFRVSVSATSGDDLSGVTFTHNSADAVILNDEASFYLTATDADKVEGANGTVDHVFTVTRTGNLNLVSTVDWAVAAGAVDAADFGGQLPTGGLTFGVGVSVMTVTVKTAGDTVTESDESFTVNLSNASTGANIITGSANGKIVSDDIAWSVSTESIPSVEGDGTTNYVFRVVRTGAITAASIDWTVAGNGSDQANASDFVGSVLPSGNVVFGQGEMTQFITVKVAGDSVREADEGFTVTLAARTDGLTHAYAQQSKSAVIGNDDDVMSIAAASAGKAEGSSGTTPFTFTVTRDGSVTGTSTVGWQIVHGDTDGADFSATSGTVSFGDGQSVATVTVNVVGDRQVEGDQGFNVQLVNAGSGSTIDGAKSTASGTIVNDDVDLTLSADDANAVEGDTGTAGQATFIVTRTGDLSVQTTVDWSVLAGTAVAADFANGQLPTGAVTFAAGESVQTITVHLSGDGADEGSEGFTVHLSNPTAHADIVGGDVAGSIVDDDDTLSVSAFLAVTAEGNVGQQSNYVFKVERSGSAIGTATADWQVTGSGTHAVDSSEFVAASGSVTFADGETTRLITVQVKGDAVGEYDEDFTVTLSNPSYGSAIDVASANATVVNDDAVLFLSADQPAGRLEGVNGAETQFTFTVVRSGDTSGASTVDWTVQTTDGNTVNAMDFGGAYPSGTVAFGAGEATRHITVTVLADAAGEFDEKFAVVLDNASQATILEGTANSFILNDDTGISIVAQGSVVKAEGNDGDVTDFVYRVKRVGDLTGTTVNWTVHGSGDYHVNADDFVGGITAGTISFADGQDYADVTLQVKGDDTVGPDEAFRIVLSGNANLINTEATGLVRNDDSLVKIAADAASHPEGNSGDTPFVFTLTRGGATDTAAVVGWDVIGSGGHPANAADFSGSLTGTVSFAAGETTQKITVMVNGDTTPETSEGFTVRLNAASGSGVSVDPTAAQASAVIAGDDQGVLLFGLDTDHAEGQAGSNTTYTYQVVRTGSTGGDVTVNYAISGMVDANDFVSPLSGSFVMAAGQDTYVLTLVARGDATVELDENFQVSLSGAFSGSSATGVLRGDDDGISVTARQSSVTEGGNVVFDVVAAGILGQTEVHWSLANALDGVDASDFAGGVIPDGVLTFAADGVQSITLQLADDSKVELNESLTLALTTDGPVGVLEGERATVAVLDNDTAGIGGETIEGNDTADMLVGHGGADIIHAGGGDDVIVIDADNLAKFGQGMEVDGGDGIDTLFFDMADQSIDLGAIESHLANVEKLDISGTGANALTVTAADLTQMASNVFNVDGDAGTTDALHQLMVKGDANDTVVIADFDNGWTKEATTYTDESGSYDVYTNTASQVQLLIDVSVMQQTVTQPT